MSRFSGQHLDEPWPYGIHFPGRQYYYLGMARNYRLSREEMLIDRAERMCDWVENMEHGEIDYGKLNLELVKMLADRHQATFLVERTVRRCVLPKGGSR